MKTKVLKSWRVVTLKGLTTTILGILTLCLPVSNGIIFIRLFGSLLIISGSILIYDYLIFTSTSDRNWRLAEGIVDGAYGFITVTLGLVTPENFLPVLTSWITLIGLLQVTNAYRLRSLFHHWKALMLNGVLAIIFSSAILVYPGKNPVNKVLIMIILSLIFISFLLISSFYLKKLVEDIALDIPKKQGEEGNQELSYY